MFPSSGAFPTYSDIIKQMKQRYHNLATRNIFSIYMLICLVTLLVPSPNSQEPHLALVTVQIVWIPCPLNRAVKSLFEIPLFTQIHAIAFTFRILVLDVSRQTVETEVAPVGLYPPQPPDRVIWHHDNVRCWSLGDEAIRISRRQEAAAAAAGIYHLITRGIIIAMITVAHKQKNCA